MKGLIRFLIPLLCLKLTITYAQIDVPVDLHTGNPIISIPIHNLSNGDIPLPISYSYTPGAVKLEQQKPQWKLIAGGSITRTVQGLPDDFKGTGADTRTGWIHGNGANIARTFSGPGTSGDPYVQNNFYIAIRGYSGLVDTEPDVFSFNCGGISGKFLFDNDKVIQVAPYQDILITPSYSSSGLITSFTITANDGKQYEFINTSTVIEKAIADVADPATIKYMREKYLKYNLPVTYYSEWSLSRIISPSGATITFSYILTPEQVKLDQKWIFINNVYTKLYSVETKTTSKVLTGVISNDNEAVISNSVVEIKHRGSTLKKIAISLSGVTVSNGKLTNPSYKFSYKTALPQILTLQCQPAPCKYVRTSSYYQRDFWGFYRGGTGDTSLVPNLYFYSSYSPDKVRLQPSGTGSYATLGGKYNRDPATTFTEYGALYKIEFPTGGYVELEYEPNQFVDVQTNATISGGGIRVRKVTIHDGVSSTNNIIKEYAYSGGRLLNRPQYSLPIHTASDATFGIAKTNYDLNPYVFDGPSVIYSYAEEIQSGKGKTAYTFSVPAVYGQVFSSQFGGTDGWTASNTNVVSFTDNTGTTSKGMMSGGYYAYPFPPNPNYDFARGLIQNVKVYNKSGAVLKETQYEYTPVYKNSTINKVYGLAFDVFSHNVADNNKFVFPYSKYEIWTGVSKLTSKEIEIVVDPTDLSKQFSSEKEYFYGTGSHRLLTETKSSVTFGGNNNKHIYRTRYKYPQDYISSASYADQASVSIKKLQDNWMNSVLIEKRSTVQKSILIGGNEVTQDERTIGGTVTKFSNFSGRIMPGQTYTLRTGVSLPDFYPSFVDQATGEFKIDSRYECVSNITAYNSQGNFLTADDGKGNLSSVHYNSTGSLQTVAISNAAADEVVYSGFEYSYNNGNYSFGTGSPSIPTTYVEGRVGYALSPNKDYIFSKSGIKKGKGDKYIFSCWVRSTVNGSLAVTVSDAAGNTSNTSIPIEDSGSTWKFKRVKIPVSNINSDFTIQVHTNVSAHFDEMVFYPELASVSMFTYQAYGENKVGESDAFGNVLLYEYDELGRNTYIRDKDNNILKRTLFNYLESKKDFASFFILKSSKYYHGYRGSEDLQFEVGEPVVFVGGYENQNVNGYKADHQRSWNFGNGSTAVDQGKPSTYIFTTPGTFTISSIVNHPIYGYDVAQKTITVVAAPKSVIFQLCVGGKVAFDLCENRIYQNGNCADQQLGTNTFEATVTAPCAGATYTYKWEKALQSSPNTWTTYGTTTTTALTNKVSLIVNPTGNPVREEDSYIMRCTITSNCTGVQSGIKEQYISFINNCN